MLELQPYQGLFLGTTKKQDGASVERHLGSIDAMWRLSNTCIPPWLQNTDVLMMCHLRQCQWRGASLVELSEKGPKIRPLFQTASWWSNGTRLKIVIAPQQIHNIFLNPHFLVLWKLHHYLARLSTRRDVYVCAICRRVRAQLAK